MSHNRPASRGLQPLLVHLSATSSVADPTGLLETKESVLPLHSHASAHGLMSPPTSFAWHGFGRQLAVAHADTSVTVWNLFANDIVEVSASNGTDAPKVPAAARIRVEPVIRISLQDDGHSSDVVGRVTTLRWMGGAADP